MGITHKHRITHKHALQHRPHTISQPLMCSLCLDALLLSQCSACTALRRARKHFQPNTITLQQPDADVFASLNGKYTAPLHSA